MSAAEPRWLSLRLLLAIHARQIREHGGARGIRDEGLLESAVFRPLHSWQYPDAQLDLAALAASYAWGIIRNHPFVDGNKRVAYVACRTFLFLNGSDFEASREEKLSTFIALASGELSEEGLAAWLRARMPPPQWLHEPPAPRFSGRGPRG